MCLGSGSNDLSTDLQQEMLVSQSRDGNQQIALAVNCKEEAMSGDPLGNKSVLIKNPSQDQKISFVDRNTLDPGFVRLIFDFWICLFVCLCLSFPLRFGFTS